MNVWNLLMKDENGKGFKIYTNAMPEEALCTLTNAVPIMFHPEWGGLPWDVHSSNVVSAMADELLKCIDPYVEKALICLSLAGDDSRGGIIKYQHSIPDALLCMLATVHQMYNLLESL